MTNSSPVLVVGGGPAGCMAAIRLAHAGVPCRLLERSPEPLDKVCGEFLSPEAVARLDALGFPWAKAQATTIRMLRLESRGRTLCLPLPFTGRSVARRFLDAWLVQAVRAAGADIELGTHVHDVVRDSDRFALRTSERAIEARTLVLATGKHNLAGFHPRHAGAGATLVGWKMNFQRLGQGLLGALHETLALFFFEGGYGGISRVADDEVTVSLLLRPSLLQGHPNDALALLAELATASPLLAQVLAESVPSWQRPKTIANLPYGHCDDAAEPGLFVVGEQFAVLPSFTGTGMSFALATGALAGRCILEMPPATAPQRYAEQAGAMAHEVLRYAMPLHRLLLRPGFARAAMTTLGFLPHILSMVAKRTRVPESSPEGEQGQAAA